MRRTPWSVLVLALAASACAPAVGVPEPAPAAPAYDCPPAAVRPGMIRLSDAARSILAAAITRGGTTLRDFTSPDGAPGYFEQELAVYGRGGEPCRRCGRPLRQALVGQRASAWCGHCQR